MVDPKLPVTINAKVYEAVNPNCQIATTAATAGSETSPQPSLSRGYIKHKRSSQQEDKTASQKESVTEVSNCELLIKTAKLRSS